MRKLLMIGALVALVALVAAPALAQNFDDFDNFDRDEFFDFFGFDRDDFDDFDGAGGVSQEFEQETDDTGDVSLDATVIGSGDNANQCVAPLQFGNTGNVQNLQGFLQYDSTADDVELEGGEFVFAPEQAVVCGQSVEQAAAASSN